MPRHLIPAVSVVGAGLTDLAVLPGRFYYSTTAGVVFLVLGGSRSPWRPTGSAA